MTNQIQQAATILEQGGLVVFPTETVYGLGADAENSAAVNAIYTAKGRPQNHPVIVHIAPDADVSYWAKDVPEIAHTLIDAFWPGPLTLILKRADHIPDTVSGGQDTIGLRCPSHPIAVALLQAFKNGKGGIAAPSANKFGRVSPTTAEHARDEFGTELAAGGLIGMVLEGEQSEVGIESTIVDVSRFQTHGAVLLRPGHISIGQLTSVLGSLPSFPVAGNAAPRVSGSLESHYAPITPVAIIKTIDLQKTLGLLDQAQKKVALLHYTAIDHCIQASIRLANDADSYAHQLYGSLRSLDQQKTDIILVEETPTQGRWHGVADRLRRAAHDSQGVLNRLVGSTDL